MNDLRTAPTVRPTRTRRRLVGLAALPIVAALTLAGCSAADQSDRDDDDRAAAGSASSASSAPSDSAVGGASATEANDALLAAVETARGAVDGGTVLSVEQEQGGSAFEVLLVTDDGTEHEVHTDASGESVTGSPRTETADADDRAEHDRYRDAAELSVDEALAAMTDRHAGTVTELGLDDHRGAVVWEGDVRDGSGTTHSLRVDAGSGQVVTDTVDTDD